MSLAAGWMAIGLALLALVPSIVPGALSVIGLLVSLLAVAVSLFSIKQNGKKYFVATVTIVLVGVFLVNDLLRVWSPLPAPLKIKLFLYGMVLLAVGVCAFIAYRLLAISDDPDKNVDAVPPPADQF